MRPYQDRHLVNDFDFDQRTLIIGPLAKACPAGQHPNTMILYFLLNTTDKPRLLAASQGQSLEKLPIFPHHRQGNLGSLDSFWASPIAKNTLIAAIQFIPLKNSIIMTHMAVRPGWRRMGINSRLVDCVRQRFPKHELIWHQPTQMGRKFIESRFS